MRKTIQVPAVGFALVLVSAALGAAAIRQAPQGIKRIDFRNFQYNVTPEEQKSFRLPMVLAVRDGKFNAGSDMDATFFKVGQILYGDIIGNGGEEAIVVVSVGLAGANGCDTDVYAFREVGGKARQMALLTEDQTGMDFNRWYPPRSDLENTIWGTDSVSIDDHYLVIARYADGPHCCPKHKVVFRYKWYVDHFILNGKPQKQDLKS